MSLEVQFLFGIFGIRIVFFSLRGEMADPEACCQMVLSDCLGGAFSSQRLRFDPKCRAWAFKAVLG